MNERFFELSAKKQRDMINGALKVFSESGYRRASMEAVARGSGVSKSLLFHYFGSKKGLYLFLCDYSEKFVVREMSNSRDWTETDCFALLSGAMRTRLRLLSVFPDILDFIAGIHREDDPEVKAELDANLITSVTDDAERLLPFVDTSMLADGAEAEKLLRMAAWMSDGFLRAHRPVTRETADAVGLEYDEYMGLLKKRFCGAQEQA